MKRWTTIVIALAAMVACALAGLPAWAQTDEEIQKIEAAMPAQARVAPAKPRKLLVFNLCKGFVHDAIPCGAKAFEIMGKKTGAFEVTSSDDPAVFAPESLNQFDAVLFNNTTGELFEDAALKQSLLDFVKGGKGVVGVHAATDCFYQWPEYGEMMGGYFSGHPWGGGDTVTVKIDDPAHPLCAVFGGRGFEVNDEIYQFKDPYSREKLRVLLSIDTAKTDMTKNGIQRTDGDFAISWVRTYGQGRVFYCSLGHNHHIFWTPDFLQYYLDGIQYAMGDLEADATPSAQLSAAYVAESKLTAQRGAVDAILKEIPKFEFGQSRERFTELNDLIIASYAQPEFRKEIADRLAALLATDATPDCKQFVCRQLFMIGTASQVPAIAALLGNPDTTDMARYALERMPDPAADDALLAALGKVNGAARVGIINSIGERRKPAAVPALANLLTDEDFNVAAAAVAALGKIGGEDAANALASAKAKASEALQPAFADAYLLCADKFLADGNKDRALAIYNEMSAVPTPKYVHIAAFEGLVKAQGAEAVGLILAALSGDDPEMQAVAAGAARYVPGAAATQELAAQLPKLPQAAQGLVIGVLADRGDAVALPAVTEAVKNADASVRLAALGALAVLGDSSIVPLLAQAAISSDEAEQGAARDSLSRLRGEDVDGALVAQLAGGDAAVKQVAIGALAARHAVSAVPALMGTAADSDEAVRIASFKALHDLASADALPQLLDLLVQAKAAGDRAEGEKTVVAVANASGNVDAFVAEVGAKIDATAEGEAKAALIRVLGGLGNDAALPALRTAAASGDAVVKDAAVRALVDWPDAEPMADLKGIAQTSDNETYRVLALRGYIRMLGLPSTRAAADTLALFKEALDMAQRPEEKKKVLAGLANVRDKAVPDLLRACLDNPELKEEAQKALDQFANVGLKVSASHGNEAAGNAIDGKMDTRWDTHAAMTGGEWFMIDLGWEQNVKKIVLDCTGSNSDYPRGYEVYVSSNGVEWGTPVVTGKGDGPVTTIVFDKPAPCSFIKIVQTGKSDGLYWSIHELSVEAE